MCQLCAELLQDGVVWRVGQECGLWGHTLGLELGKFLSLAGPLFPLL